ncbi:MAG TPA: methyltetrahydrofolate--corrinoid methyltransferase [Planctomycetaceae bacterium]|nr:methyltetrahydrofolate--corrinoid methyltransferase [Planctomycetaceae bacterium]HIQ21429.1 methyltetrahydrofolate--corrinoid methyltransferase [Planctomycetota bacterium]
MIIFSERINGMYRDVRRAINEKQKAVVQQLVKEQVDGGADVIDINLGPTKGDPVENFVWLAETVHEVTDKPLSLDSAKPDVLTEATARVKQVLPETKLIINSSTAVPEVMAKLISAAAENGAGIIGLTMDQEGVPGNVEKRVECGATFLMTAMEGGLSPDDIYLDPIILPVNVAPKQPWNVMEAIRQLAVVNDPPPKFIIGLSNISQKCLMNRLINRTYLVMCIAAGLNAAIMDAADKELVEAAITAEVLLEKHLYSDDYIKAWRMQKGLA